MIKTSVFINDVRKITGLLTSYEIEHVVQYDSEMKRVTIFLSHIRVNINFNVVDGVIRKRLEFISRVNGLRWTGSISNLIDLDDKITKLVTNYVEVSDIVDKEGHTDYVERLFS